MSAIPRIGSGQLPVYNTYTTGSCSLRCSRQLSCPSIQHHGSGSGDRSIKEWDVQLIQDRVGEGVRMRTQCIGLGAFLTPPQALAVLGCLARYNFSIWLHLSTGSTCAVLMQPELGRGPCLNTRSLGDCRAEQTIVNCCCFLF